MKPQIKFSHRYYKMPPLVEDAESITNILQLFICDHKELSRAFKEYDVSYEKPNGDCGEYELPESKVIVILLETYVRGEGNFAWTTIRRWTPQKEKYYQSIVGQEVQIVLNENTA